jgi:hypothetical protein
MPTTLERAVMSVGTGAVFTPNPSCGPVPHEYTWPSEVSARL